MIHFLRSFFLIFLIAGFGLNLQAKEIHHYTFDGWMENFLSSEYFSKNPQILDYLEHEVTTRPNGGVAKTIKEIETVLIATQEDFSLNPDLWEDLDSWNTYEAARDRVFSNSSLGLSSSDSVAYSFLSLLDDYKREIGIDTISMVLNGEYGLESVIPYFLKVILQNSVSSNSNDRIMHWGLQFPVFVGEDSYQASLVQSPDEISGQENGIATYFRGVIEIDGLQSKSQKNIFVVSDPFGLLGALLEDHKMDLYNQSAVNEEGSRCVSFDEKHPLTIDTFHTHIDRENFDYSCFERYQEFFSPLTLTYESSPKPPHEIFPEFNKLFAPEKKTIDILVVSSKADGFGLSNFLSVTSHFTRKFSNGPHGGVVAQGPFAEIFDYNLNNNRASNEDFPKIGERTKIIESSEKGPLGQTFRIHFVYSAYDYSEILQKYAPDKDIIIYQGHMGYGHNLKEFSKISFPGKRYQTLFVLACNSYSNVLLNFRTAKKLADFSRGEEYWDFIGSGSYSPLWQSEEVMQAFLDFYYKAWLTYSRGHDMTRFNYGTLLATMNSIESLSDWKPAGINDNRFSPNNPNTRLESYITHDDQVFSVIEALRFLISIDDHEVTNTIVANLKDENRVAREALNEGIDEFLGSPSISESDKAKIRLLYE